MHTSQTVTKSQPATFSVWTLVGVFACVIHTSCLCLDFMTSHYFSDLMLLCVCWRVMGLSSVRELKLFCQCFSVKFVTIWHLKHGLVIKMFDAFISATCPSIFVIWSVIQEQSSAWEVVNSVLFKFIVVSCTKFPHQRTCLSAGQSLKYALITAP